MIKKTLFLTVLGMLLLLNTVKGQEYEEVLYSVNLGPTLEMFSSPSTPFTASVDVRKRKGDLLAWVSGVSFNYTDNDRVDGFLSRSEVNIYYTQLYGGVRLYASKRLSKHQYYGGANVGIGGVYKEEGPSSREESGFALLGNVNLNIGTIIKNRFIISGSADIALNTEMVGYIFYNLKVGYQFGL
jgi:hypothetical protein